MASPGKCPVCLAQCDPEKWVQLDASHGVKPNVVEEANRARQDISMESERGGLSYSLNMPSFASKPSQSSLYNSDRRGGGCLARLQLCWAGV